MTVDLTKLTVPFGSLPNHIRNQLLDWAYMGGAIEVFDTVLCRGWVEHDGASLRTDRIYRMKAAPAPDTEHAAPDRPELSRYWLVHGIGPANRKHTSRADAEAEALRLAKQHPDKTFVVLEAVSAVRSKASAIWCAMSEPAARSNEVPF